MPVMEFPDWLEEAATCTPRNQARTPESKKPARRLVFLNKWCPDSKSIISSTPCFNLLNNWWLGFLPAFLPTSILLQVRNLKKIQ
jgi:hypothetical protein